MSRFDLHDHPWNHESVRTSRFDAVLADLPIEEETSVTISFRPEGRNSWYLGVTVGDSEELALLDPSAVGALMEELAHRGLALANRDARAMDQAR